MPFPLAKQLPSKRCTYCGLQFQPNSAPHKYCSLSCCLWPKIQINGPDECWPWQAYLSISGYGKFAYKSVTSSAHRYVWSISVGPIPKGKHVLHKCDNRKCCNPNHLYLGTHQDNMRDRVGRGRNAHNKGESCGKSKLTESQVLLIREFRKNGTPLSKIAKKFNIAKSTVHQIVTGQTWKHLLTP